MCPFNRSRMAIPLVCLSHEHRYCSPLSVTHVIASRSIETSKSTARPHNKALLQSWREMTTPKSINPKRGP